MPDYYDKNLNLTFSLYENKIMYNYGSGSVDTKKMCSEYWFNNQSDIGGLHEMSEISYKVSGSNSYIKDNNWNNISDIMFTESDVINHWYSSDNTKTITDVVNDMKNIDGCNDEQAKELIKEQFPIVKDLSI